MAPLARLLCVIDITGSMACELEGVTSAVAKLAVDAERMDMPLSFAIATFTEHSGGAPGSGCFTSLQEFDAAKSASDYISNLQLCRPPEAPDVEANGGDGPENHKAALLRLCHLDPSVPTIGFLITDAPPHLKGRHSGDTRRHELAWLTAQGLPASEAEDMFLVLKRVLSHFRGSLVLNCVVFGVSGNTEVSRVWGRVAQATGGMLLNPLSRSPDLLSEGMLSIVRALLSRLVLGQPEFEADSLEGFQLLDVSGLPPAETEEDLHQGSVTPGDQAELFDIAMERICAVCGRRWSKRAIGITAASEQLQFVWHTARFIAAQSAARANGAAAAAAPAALPAADSSFAASSAALSELLALRESIVQKLPDDVKGHFNITEADIKQLAAEASTASEGSTDGAAVSAISLESVGEALGEDADWQDWLASVMRLLLGYPLHLQLPLDRFGQPDFMDAWSAVPEAIGVDRMSSADFMRLVGDAQAARGPTDKAPHNAFLVVAEPGDTAASMVFRIASGTQVLNYITAVAMGARGNAFLPNLHAGAAAATLLQIVMDRSLTEFRWRQACALAHTLRCYNRAPAGPLARQLAAGCAYPADPPSKLVAAALATAAASGGSASTRGGSPPLPSAAVLRLVLEEWLAVAVQRHHGKSTPESDAAYLALIAKYLPFQLLLGSTPPSGNSMLAASSLDPLTELHPLEAGGALSDAGSLHGGWRAAALSRLRGEVEGLERYPVREGFERCARALLKVLLSPSDDLGAAAASNGSDDLLAQVWPEWEVGLLQALLLRMRTARYVLHRAEVEGGEVEQWERVEVSSLEELLLSRLRAAHADELAQYRRARAAAAEAALLGAAASALRGVTAADAAADASGSMEERYSKVLESLYVAMAPRGISCSMSSGSSSGAARPESAPRGPFATLLGTSVSLTRGSVPAILEQLLQKQGSTQGGQQEGCAAESVSEEQRVPEALLTALVCGDWTTAPPQALRSSALVRQQCAGQPELLAAMSANLKCRRQEGCNRLGHSDGLQYPGPCGWTAEYSTARIAALGARQAALVGSHAKLAKGGKSSKSGIKRKGAKGGRAHSGQSYQERRQQVLKAKQAAYLQQMQKYTQLAALARAAAAAGGDAGVVAAVEDELLRWDDANMLPWLAIAVDGILGGMNWRTSIHVLQIGKW